eukprot:gene55596-76180_t
MIDICDFAVGLSRQLYGLTIATERPGHRMMETWHPLGVCGVISAFNFPVAVWSWNAALALVCGDSVVWKPSEKTPLTALATHAIAQRAIARFGADAPEGLLELIVGQRDIGEVLVDDARVPVLSATGSTAMGRAVGPRRLAFTSETLLLSFALPNFHFHAAMAYAILRTRGVPLGKSDYEGLLRTRPGGGIVFRTPDPMPDRFIGPTSQTFISQRLRLHYADWGNPDAPPLTLLASGGHYVTRHVTYDE